MQVLQWLFKGAQEQPRETSPGNSTNKKETASDQKAKSKDIVLLNNHRVNQRLKREEESKLGCKNLYPFIILRRKDIEKTCFSSTLSLKRLGSFHRRQHYIHPMKMKKEDIAGGVLGINHKADSAEVLPISDTALSSSANVNDECGTVEKKDEPKGDKTRTISKMKELLRWAASAKSKKRGKYISPKVLHLRNRATLKAVSDDDQLRYDSPKISFRWDVERCSTSSSAYSAISMASSSKNDQTVNMPSLISTPIHDRDQCTSRTGNWITTDSEFVVLEL
uniref:Uncharacterized protein n=1 Tax=Davidia involucrata TaxID=16924 RepID=A0A5B6YUU5_DAVIN